MKAYTVHQPYAITLYGDQADELIQRLHVEQGV